MNMFYDYEGICGNFKTNHLKHRGEELLDLAVTMRAKLGRQSYLLDQYLSFILEGMCASTAFDAVDRGMSISGELNGLCTGFLRGSDRFRNHPYYASVRDYIDAHPLDCQEHYTKHRLYCIALMDGFTEYAAKTYWEELKKRQREVYDMVHLRDLYRQITALLGSENEIEQLNLLLRQRLLLVTPMDAFLQSLNESLLYSLTHRDAETSKQVFQLLLDQSA